MTENDFLKFSEHANVIPVDRQINADLDTPVSSFLKIAHSDYGFLFESVEGQEKIARYSFLGSNPYFVFKAKNKNIEIIYPGRKKVKRFITATNPLDEIRRIMRGFVPAEVGGLPRFYGGLVGYIGYDAVRFFEEIPDKNPDDLGMADFTFMFTDTLLVFDHVRHTIKIIAAVILPKGTVRLLKAQKVKLYNQAVKKIEAIQRQLGKCSIESVNADKINYEEQKVISNYTKKEFCGLVEKVKEYIKQGDIIQAVLSQRFKIRTKKSPFDIYRTLRSINPSPYMFFLKLGNAALAGSSPEILVRCEDGIVRTRPIAGTRPRGKTPEEDSRMEKELLNDEKEKAEHIMLVDLGRNDLGRVCKPASISISEFMNVEKYSHVMHLVTEVRGELSDKYDIYDVLRACFPAGTVSGSPKIRAMEIIDELENLKRGPYAGCVGYFSFSHNMDTCITIRTVLVKDNVAYFQAGAGIVADSVPEREYQETVNKAKALIEAITN